MSKQEEVEVVEDGRDVVARRKVDGLSVEVLRLRKRREWYSGAGDFLENSYVETVVVVRTSNGFVLLDLSQVGVLVKVLGEVGLI